MITHMKMQVMLKGNTGKWFDRKFDFSFGEEMFDEILSRLGNAPQRLAHTVMGVAEDFLMRKFAGKWSAKEHTGHLSVLEPLWRTRFTDIAGGKAVLTTADLDNKATTEAGFNGYGIFDLLEAFKKERKATLMQLQNMNAQHSTFTSMHPRLQQPMRIMDLAFFVAEHDDHHISAILKLNAQ